VDERERAFAALISRRGRRLVPVELRVGHDDEVLVGHPAEALGCVSNEVDLLVCGTHGLGSSHDTSGPLIGLESHDVVDDAFCAVLLVPGPDGSDPAPPPAPASATFVTK
jgi:nucleotide-binding universal stress UspA family protein